MNDQNPQQTGIDAMNRQSSEMKARHDKLMQENREDMARRKKDMVRVFAYVGGFIAVKGLIYYAIYWST